MGYFTHAESKNKKWVWILMAVLAVFLIVLFMYKKNRKPKSDTDSCDYDHLTTGDECIACCKDENQDKHSPVHDQT